MKGADLAWAVDAYHVARARAWYKCHTAAHTASTLAAHYRPHLKLEFGYTTGDNITTGFGSELKSTKCNT